MNLDPLPDAEKMIEKDAYRERYSALLGKDYDEFMRYNRSYLTKSIRVNTLKISVSEAKKRIEAQGFTLTQVPWCREGFWIKGERTDIGNLYEHFLGYIYVQEAASMIPPVVLQPQPGELVLDMAASPGSKTTQIAAMMSNEGVLIANDVTGDRMKALGLNLQRMGIYNAIVNLGDALKFKKRNLQFDRILLDAPCSGTGTIRKSPDTLKMWNPGMIRRLSGLQKKLILVAYDRLKEGGTLVYSTCSTEPEENEEVIDFLLQKTDAKIEKIDLDIKRANPILKFEKKTFSSEISKTLRLWPHLNNTEGFFVAKITKT